jgi:hypothetical protein
MTLEMIPSCETHDMTEVVSGSLLGQLVLNTTFNLRTLFNLMQDRPQLYALGSVSELP